ncbi:MAG: diadenylate cyclase CdaA [Lachnospiraceae bacterium]|nr:diadenylate cyclase CdaA [Lachnospiraceae bacterium]
MDKIIDNLKSWMSLLPPFEPSNFVEVIIISIIVYEILLWIKNTRAWTLLKGILVILVFTLFAAIFRLNTILWILERISYIAVTALIIIFQPELRKALEQLGSQSVWSGITSAITRSDDNTMTKEAASQISKAVYEMAKVKTGALIVIEQSESLDEFVKTGITINGEVSSGLLINIFEKNTPLHDGAVIMKGDTVVAATCYLPLSDNMDISKDLGTRHRAALGISEVTDSLTIVVSEETGRVSVAYRGKLTRIPDESALDKVLINRINKAEIRFFGRSRRNEAANA